jgi:hypothetical protein
MSVACSGVFSVRRLLRLGSTWWVATGLKWKPATLARATSISSTTAPDMFAWDTSGGIQKSWFDAGKTTLWGGCTNSSDGIGGLINPLGGANPGRSLRANSIPGIPFVTEVTGSEVTKWYLAADQSIESAVLDLYIGYQHIEAEIDLIDFARKRLNAPFRNFDLVFTGARIYF